MSFDYIVRILNPEEIRRSVHRNGDPKLGGQSRVAEGSWPLAREAESLEHQHGDQQEQSQTQRAD